MIVSMSVIQEVLPLAATAGATAGYAAGRVANYFAERHAEDRQDGVVEDWNNLEVERDTSLRARVSHNALAKLALVGAMTGFAVGHAVKNHEVEALEPPKLTVLVDHTYAAGRSGNVDKIDKVTQKIAETDNLQVNIKLTHNSHTESASVEEVKKDTPLGQPVMPQALPQAIKDTYSESSEATTNRLGPSESRNSGILVVTAGNSVGEPKEVIDKAEANGDMQVFIADVSDKKTKETKNLKEIADETDGKYWQGEGSGDEIAEMIQADIVPEEATYPSDSERWPWAAAAIFGFGYGIRELRSRRRDTAQVEA